MVLIGNLRRNSQRMKYFFEPKRILFFVALAVCVCIAWYCYVTGAFSATIIEEYRINYPFGVVGLFILIYAVSVIASIPSLPLNLVAGFFWGGVYVLTNRKK